MTPPTSETIVRTIHTSPSTLIYAVPPLNPNSKGYTAAQWTIRPPIFTARLHIIETSTPNTLTTLIRLEDPSTADLFAEAPYTHPSVVTPCIDSARFFAVRVVGGGGMKATLGVGYEERADAFDFKAALADQGRVLGFGNGGRAGGRGGETVVEEKGKARELRLKEGEMFTIDIGGGGGKNTDALRPTKDSVGHFDAATLLSIEPPPPPAAGAVTISSHHEEVLDEVQAEDEDDGFGDFQ